ncbi:hypothetical protein O1611_g1255 [Lasiodiplodia mahajangana]|uniref:Uncharacterized protein n=1 Tax=Lasiodiplodia mahajangana TaxID=1108764 RepID=A0ACC2JY11_9PEZI|nr:hypothetical protein O1611_g1255 [Lasiodiplodia mahajangana]
MGGIIIEQAPPGGYAILLYSKAWHTLPLHLPRAMAQDKPATKECDFVEEGGYVRLAGHMGRYPQLAILRRFGTLANETLLYYQAEITQLEHRIRCIQDQDNQSDDENRRLYARSWISLSESSLEEPGCPQREQYELLMKLRKLMAEYHQALYFHREALALRSPHKKILGDLREWMRRPIMGRITILSWDWRTWETCDEKDLITFEDSTMDRFTSLVTYTIIDIYHNIIGRHIHNAREKSTLPLNYADHRHTVTYTHKSIARFTQAFTVLIACTLPVAAIVILYIVENTATRLGIIALLTGLFSISMSLLTMATLQEIFAATAAFAAVLVFFLGSTNNAA